MTRVRLVNRTRAVPRLGVSEHNLWSEALHGGRAASVEVAFTIEGERVLPR